MITLATLPQATEQEVFDQVAVHLLTQNQRSLAPTRRRCSYRGANNLKCAAGCLISDEEYSEIIEGYTWEGLIEKKRVPKDHAQLVAELQDIHDKKNAADWKEHLIRLAEKYGICTAAIDNL